MFFLLWPGIVIFVAGVIVWEKKRMLREPEIRERLAHPVRPLKPTILDQRMFDVWYAFQ